MRFRVRPGLELMGCGAGARDHVLSMLWAVFDPALDALPCMSSHLFRAE